MWRVPTATVFPLSTKSIRGSDIRSPPRRCTGQFNFWGRSINTILLQLMPMGWVTHRRRDTRQTGPRGMHALQLKHTTCKARPFEVLASRVVSAARMSAVDHVCLDSNRPEPLLLHGPCTRPVNHLSRWSLLSRGSRCSRDVPCPVPAGWQGYPCCDVWWEGTGGGGVANCSYRLAV